VRMAISHSSHQTDDRRKALGLISVSRETLEKLDILVAELRKWQNIKNLVGPSAIEQIWTRHIADSVQLLQYAPNAHSWLDLGSGGGFPGLVLAILRSERCLHETHLVESNGRKCAFLRHVVRLTGISAHIHETRVEAFLQKADAKADVVSARALASLDQLLAWTNTLLRNGALGIFPKGQDVDTELKHAAISWNFEAECRPSLTDQQARIVLVRMNREEDLSHVIK
jgi:16S rRNA (guanine527-N7)-methyltransferase